MFRDKDEGCVKVILRPGLTREQVRALRAEAEPFPAVQTTPSQAEGERSSLERDVAD